MTMASKRIKKEVPLVKRYHRIIKRRCHHKSKTEFYRFIKIINYYNINNSKYVERSSLLQA